LEVALKRLDTLICLMAGVSFVNSVSAQTLHPLYKYKSDEVFEKTLLGTWVSCAGNAGASCVGVQVERSPDNGYKVTMFSILESPKVDLVLRGHVVRLGDALFGDLSLTDVVVGEKSLAASGLQFREIHTHAILRLSLKGEKLVTSSVDFQREETRKALAENGIELHLENLEDGSVLALASTAELQRFARKMADDKRVFSDDDEWEHPKGDPGEAGTRLNSSQIIVKRRTHI
jgi:hypothetical protein